MVKRDLGSSIKLDDRLKTAVSFARKGSVAADIGTDHGYLICELVRKKTAPYGYACDINEKPLDKARELIAECGLENKIECFVCDGVRGLPKDKIEDVYICGMGGETIIGIMERGKWLFSERVHLVLQPMTKTEALRRWLCRNGFRIDEERAAEADGRLYTVMSVYYSGEGFEPDDIYCAVGELPGACGSKEKAYILWQAGLRRSIADGMEKGHDLASAVRFRAMADMLEAEAEEMELV